MLREVLYVYLEFLVHVPVIEGGCSTTAFNMTKYGRLIYFHSVSFYICMVHCHGYANKVLERNEAEYIMYSY